MGIEDRDYMRRRPDEEDWSGRNEPARSFAIRGRTFAAGLAALALVVTVTLLARRSSGGRPPAPTQERSRQTEDGRFNSSAMNKPQLIQSKTQGVAGTLVNVNQASLEQLDELPYISPQTAQAIIDGRPYSKPEDLLRVKGIGRKTLERVQPHIEVR